ncbi:hypothetical protein [Qipengyuania sphaerica]|uniref:hypothetical protein n=1 Tax=Qipengyuania sphaerica TaxID=2867243 RepID=UPI001C8812B1|nr:hypothetical protein [Qipengyuania sphaerica]MBX7540303.1 hypothetical protein [Qipengyuania sphaerica]
MEIPSLDETDANLRDCLLLKADDLHFTLANPLGERLRNEFLGVTVEGLADENLSPEQVASIDLSRFAIADTVHRLHSMLEERQLSLLSIGQPDADYARQDALDFLEHFLSTLPDVALGGVDLTAAGYGSVRRIYNLAFAWINLVETIEEAFEGQTESALAVTDLALLSGLDQRTVRNRCGPKKEIRTSSNRSSRDRASASPAFVRLHSLDAVNWLKERKTFRIDAIDSAWISRRLDGLNGAQTTRGLLLASVVNTGPLASLAEAIGSSPEIVRKWFDDGSALPADKLAAVTSLLKI